MVSVDDSFQGTEEWYDEMAVSCPPKDHPWYHVLVDGADHETYVAERHLEHDSSGAPVEHPLLRVFFDELRDGRYVRTRPLN